MKTVPFLKKFYVVGISFKKTDTEHRNKFALTTEGGRKAYNQGSYCLEHFMVLSTCNRTEIYGFAPCEYVLISFLRHLSVASPEEVSAAVYTKEGNEAVKHLLTVAAGLDSQIPGDYEVIGQIRKAFQLSKELGRSNSYIERVVSQANQVSKAIKNKTAFSDGTVSVSYLVTREISKIIKKEGFQKVCIVGLGKIGHNTLKYLKQHAKNSEILLVNRGEKKLLSIASQYGLRSFSYNNLSEAIKECQIIILATSAEQPILYLEQLQNTKVHYIFDLSVPRNAAEDVYQCRQLKVFDVDEISAVVNSTLISRMSEVPKVEAIVESKAQEFFEWQERRMKRSTSPELYQQLIRATPIDSHVENSHPGKQACFMANQCCEGKTQLSWLPVPTCSA